MMNPFETHELGKRYGTSWALQKCSLSLPEGSITALIGPNGAGKSTLLHVAIGLQRPDSGSVAVFGLQPITNATQILPRIGFVAQDRPLYGRLTVSEMCEMASRLNSGWDRDLARTRLDYLGIDPGKRIARLSGGQQAQVALVLAVAKHPELLLLDEPTASLDPLARREFLKVLMECVVNDGATVVLSSHNVSDLERVCDRVVILAHGNLQVSEEVDSFTSTHRLLVGPPATERDLQLVGKVIHVSHTDRQTTVLVRKNGHVYDARWDIRDVGFEDLVLGYLQRPRSSSSGEPEVIAS